MAMTNARFMRRMVEVRSDGVNAQLQIE